MAKGAKTKHGKHMSAQCKMRSTDTDGKGEGVTHVVSLDGSANYYEYVSWIPAKYGKKGAWIKIKGYAGNWQVVEVWSIKPEADANERSRDHLHQRKASDV